MPPTATKPASGGALDGLRVDLRGLRTIEPESNLAIRQRQADLIRRLFGISSVRAELIAALCFGEARP